MEPFIFYIYIYIYCKDLICSIAQMDGQWPNEPKTMNLLESKLEIKLSMSQVDNDHNRLIIIRKNETNNFEQEKFSSVKSEENLFLYISLRLIQKLQFLSTQ